MEEQHEMEVMVYLAQMQMVLPGTNANGVSGNGGIGGNGGTGGSGGAGGIGGNGGTCHYFLVTRMAVTQTEEMKETQTEEMLTAMTADTLL